MIKKLQDFKNFTILGNLNVPINSISTIPQQKQGNNHFNPINFYRTADLDVLGRL